MGIPIKNYKNRNVSNRLEEILPDGEIYITRSIQDFINWVGLKCEELTREAKQNDIFKKAVRCGMKKSNKFYDEVIPLKQFFVNQTFFDDTAMVTLNRRTTSWDAKITDNNGGGCFIEIVGITRNKEEFYRSNILNEVGWVNCNSKITKNANGTLSGGNYGMISGEEKVSNLTAKIGTEIEKKQNKRYPKNTILVIGGGYEYLRKEDEIKIKDLLGKYSGSKFSGIYFVSLDGSFVGC